MKNLKRALSLVLSAAMMVGMMVVGTSAASFTDVEAGNHLEAIEVMNMIGVMEGTGDGTFDPDRIVTRNEMAVVICNLMDLKLNGAHNFTDVPAWADKYVAAMYTNGLTSGTSATTYGGANNVTTTEAALMVMKTLGWFEYQGEFEDDWKIATVKKALELDLFDDIDAGINDGLTRGEVAQLVLNALTLPVINQHEKGGLNVSGNGISVSQRPSYEPEIAYNSLIEKLYDDTLWVNKTHDAYGRPAMKWTYTGNGEDQSVTAPEKAALVITASKTEDDMKGLLKNYDLYSIAVVTNGSADYVAEDKNEDGNVDLDKDGNEIWNKVYTAGTAAAYAALTGNGQTVEIYVDKYNDVTDIVVFNEYVAKVTKIVKADEDTDTKRAIVLDYDADLKFETESFSKDDMVTYNLIGGKVKNVNTAEFVEGKVTGVVDGKSLKIDGVTYKYDVKYDMTKAPELGDDVKIYLDSNGYLLKNGKVDPAAPAINDFVIITKTANDDFGTKQVKVLKADGTTEIVGIEVKNDSIPAEDTVVDGKTIKGIKTYEGQLMIMKDADADGKCEFKAPAYDTDSKKYAGFDAYAANANDTAGKPSLFVNTEKDTLNNGWNIADDAVVFVINAKGEYSVMTGSKLATSKTADVVMAAYGNEADSGFVSAQLLFAKSEKVSAGDIQYGYVTADVEKVKNADDEIVNAITFWNGAETVTLLTDADNVGKVAKDTKDTKGTTSSTAFFSYKITDDGEMTDIAPIVNFGYISAFDGENMTFNGSSAKYEVNEDTVIVYVDIEETAGAEDGAISLATENEDDGNESVKTYFNNVIYGVDTVEETVTFLFVDIQNDIQDKM